MQLKFISKKISVILILSIVATSLYIEMFKRNPVVLEVMSDGKVPVTIIMYHSILKDGNKAGEYVISPTQFENDIKYLVDNGYSFITMTDLINFVKKRGAKLPDKPVMITFDDGYYNNYMYAYPIIKKYDGCLVLSILGYNTDINKEDEKLSGYYSHVTWEQVKEMSKSGHVEIQNHSYKLHTNSNGRSGSMKKSNESVEQYKEFLTDDLMKLQRLLKENADIEPNTFTYPFGARSQESIDILKELGFEAALTCHNGINYVGKGDTELLYKLKRYNRPHGKSSADYFKDKLEGL